MTFSGWLQIFLLLSSVFMCVKPFGCYLYWVYEQPDSLRFPIIRTCEAFLFQLCGISQQEQDWKSYTGALLIFSLMGILIIFTLLRFQDWFPLNSQGLPPVPCDLALNIAVSFVTNTNWQPYAGETTLSMGMQMVGLTWQNFVSPASGVAVALALARGLTRHSSLTQTGLGNFWIDVIRTLIYILLPLSFLVALIFVGQGVIQNFSANLHITTLEGLQQILPMGPLASQEAIKVLGTNGGGFLNANSAHPFENPTA
ncbi:MAG: potassium-transporting ATPase subunit KdpA, partial [Alphaproteobacteria bacterium]|nr:potassium-transporting ATPase subunit KdpA [Alphaproteobacteria bacterium]